MTLPQRQLFPISGYRLSYPKCPSQANSNFTMASQRGCPLVPASNSPLPSNIERHYIPKAMIFGHGDLAYVHLGASLPATGLLIHFAVRHLRALTYCSWLFLEHRRPHSTHVTILRTARLHTSFCTPTHTKKQHRKRSQSHNNSYNIIIFQCAIQSSVLTVS